MYNKVESEMEYLLYLIYIAFININMSSYRKPIEQTCQVHFSQWKTS